MEAWRKKENAGSFDQLTKGTLLTMEGYFKPEEWSDKDGVKHNRIVMVATKFYPAVEKEEAPANRKRNRKRQEITSALSGQSGLKAAFVLLVTVPERPHFYTPSYSTRRVRRRPLISRAKLRRSGIGKARLHFRLTTINSQARQYLLNANEIVHGTIRFLLALFPFCPPCGPHVKSNPAGRGEPSESRDKKQKLNLKFKTHEADDLVKL